MTRYLDKLIQAVPSAVYQCAVTPDGRWSIRYMSEGVRDLYECSPETACTDHAALANCIVEEDRASFRSSVEQATKQLVPWRHEYRIRTPGGKIKWVRGQARPERQDDGPVYWNGILVDISENKAAEAHLLRLQKMYAAVIDANRLISRSKDQTELFRGICKIAVDLGGMKMAWIGIPEEADQRMMPVASYGEGTDYLDKVLISARSDLPEGQGPSGTAFRENRTVLNLDFQENPLSKPWHEYARVYGWGSSATFPIQNGGQPFAALTVYSAETNAFDNEVVALLEMLAADISQAVTALSGAAERKLLEDALRFRQFGLDHADEGVFWIDQAARVLDANERACRMLGYAHAELLQLTIADINPDFPIEKWPEYWQEVKRYKTRRFESFHKCRDGTLFPVEIVTNYFEYEGVEYHCALVRDIVERKQMELALAESEKRFSLFMDTLPAAAFIKGEDGTTLYANRHMSDILGARNWIGKSTRDLFPPELAEQMIADDRRSLEAGYVVIEEQVPNVEGQLRTYQTHKFRIPRQDQPALLGGISLDVTERKQMEEQIRNLAYFDSLTDLPNRRMLLDRLMQALFQARRRQGSLAVMFLDLDNFKRINDSLGHDIGDELLKAVSVLLRACVRTGDTISRLGGDEFIILLSEIARPDDAALVADKIIRTINAPIHVAGNTLNISTSIGIAVYPVDGSDDAQELMKKADRAMYAAKDAGRNGYRFFVN
jgi:diguanylate cyclase (GGDEF)-like protein/PAS domain S-box-containing protein